MQVARITAISMLVIASVLGASAIAAEKPTPAAPELLPVNAKQVHEIVRRPGAAATLVNVWATWCIPCREEFPDLMKVYRELQPEGLRLVLVSADFDDDRQAIVKQYLRAQGVDFTTYLKEEQDQEFIDGLAPQWSGALPVTLFYDAKGELQDIWEGAGSYKTLKKKAKSVLGSKTRPKEVR